jgi:ppGpp synthetase/RelA/SpoT-type nucleotidyltranferase
LEKAAKLNDDDGSKKYKHPLAEIQDQVGARVITFYRSDVSTIAAQVEKYYRAIEAVDKVPHSEWEFGYFGKHYIFVIPTDVIVQGADPKLVPKFFELQIKTLFQHAWSEANHDLGYKPEGDELSSEQKRKLAYSSAQAWGADMIFDEMHQEQKRQ